MQLPARLCMSCSRRWGRHQLSQSPHSACTVMMSQQAILMPGVLGTLVGWHSVGMLQLRLGELCPHL